MSETGTRRQAYNPYLPSWEYIPDGEPYVFGDRVYVYGSHDFYNGCILYGRLCVLVSAGGQSGRLAL